MKTKVQWNRMDNISRYARVVEGPSRLKNRNKEGESGVLSLQASVDTNKE